MQNRQIKQFRNKIISNMSDLIVKYITKTLINYIINKNGNNNHDNFYNSIVIIQRMFKKYKIKKLKEQNK